MGKWIVLGALALSAVAVTPQPARAMEEGCTTTLGHCYEAAARIDSFWWRLAAGLDCELDYAECVRIKVMGS
ncbi:MAG: hypothetical protein A3H96_00175 [Acidobacteria bacterium RIFCSPLOWO2_02_FULL_67_36]|nr:MAG: hypothetical protein A3H96_00175 [Acidobacteria bacterium RIFCSPLOWO2_02_FULL_67_36]OFW19605.1 MAG: hypothetical protein A3G21_21615 [Acidobacteria bacterium RIFCSPLOWO2_12_FULL_66_21]